MSTVVGLDLSLTSTGVAVLSAGGIQMNVQRVRSAGKKDDTLAQRKVRLGRLAFAIEAVVDQAHPDLVVVEGPALGNTQGHMHDRSGLWWLLVFKLSARYPLVEVPPTNLKKYAAGKGNASKDEVLTSVVRRYSSVPVADNNEADALVLAAMGMRHLGDPVEKSVPAINLVAMNAVNWP